MARLQAYKEGVKSEGQATTTMAAVGHAGPMDVEAWREELRSVLESRSFRQAPTLSHLLRYLCEKLFAGESSQIKEYSIGVEMFRRGDSFDQETDSIVRVEVNRLRKRLADYYAGEGASHKLQIVIPVGQYVPSFVSTVREPEAKPRGSSDGDSGASLVAAALDLGGGSRRSCAGGGNGLVGGAPPAAAAPGGGDASAGTNGAGAAGGAAARG